MAVNQHLEGTRGGTACSLQKRGQSQVWLGAGGKPSSVATFAFSPIDHPHSSPRPSTGSPKNGKVGAVAWMSLWGVAMTEIDKKIHGRHGRRRPAARRPRLPLAALPTLPVTRPAASAAGQSTSSPALRETPRSTPSQKRAPGGLVVRLGGSRPPARARRGRP